MSDQLLTEDPDEEPVNAHLEMYQVEEDELFGTDYVQWLDDITESAGFRVNDKEPIF